MLAVKQQADRAWKAGTEARSGQGVLQGQLHKALGDLDSLRTGFVSMRDRVKDLEAQNLVRLLQQC